MDKEIEAFRNEVMHCRKNVNQAQRRYSEAMKTKALQLLARLRKNGVVMQTCAARLGLPVSMLYAWKKTSKRIGMVPVRIIPETKVGASTHSPSRLQIVSPRGYRIEVSDLQTVISVLREIG
jgi:hypothetical protein